MALVARNSIFELLFTSFKKRLLEQGSYKDEGGLPPPRMHML